MINEYVKRYLDSEIKRLKCKYDTKRTSELEKIAIKEYGVSNIINSSIIDISKAKKTQNGIYILYHAKFKPYEPLVLAHEIGHIAAGHLDKREEKLYEKEMEEEADYFSINLNEVSKRKYLAYLTIDIILKTGTSINPLNPYKKKKEIERLKMKKLKK